MLLAPTLSMVGIVLRDVVPSPSPVQTMTIVDSGWMHANIQWEDASADWKNPCILQRKSGGSFPTPNLGNAQDIESNFIWVGVREANRYTDVTLTEGTTYEYRACYVTNYDSVVRDSASPVYTEWQYGEVTTSTRSSVTTINVVTDHSADNTGATNSWDAFQAAVVAAKAADYAEIYVPAGTYTIYPTDPAVTFDGTYLKVVNGQSYSSALITGDSSNITIRGDVDGGGAPSTFINCRLWHNRPGTEYLTVLNSPGGDPTNDNDVANIKRYGFWLCSDPDSDVENVVLKNVDVDMTSTPVSTGKRWYSLDEKRTQWDISQKLMYGFWNTRNVLLDNVRAKNIRGEIAYWGGLGCEKYRMTNCVFSASNSSIVSMSADAEYENCTFSDFSNSGIESAPHSKNGDDNASQLTSPFGSYDFYQDTIVRGCTFNCLDQSVNGIMKDLADLETAENSFAGIHIFNQKGTFQSVTDCTITAFRNLALGPWYECYNSFYNNLTITNPRKGSGSVIYLNPTPWALYKLSGGMDYNYWSNINFTLGDVNLNNSGAFFKNFASMNSENNTIIDKMTIDGGGGSISRLWQDKYTNALGRDGFELRDWSSTNLSTDTFSFFVNLNGATPLPLPSFEDFDFEWHQRVINEANGNTDIYWGQTTIENWESDSNYDFTSVDNISEHQVGSYLKFKPHNGSDTIIFRVDPTWNNFNQEYTITGTEVLTCQVVSEGTNKLQFVSKV